MILVTIFSDTEGGRTAMYAAGWRDPLPPSVKASKELWRSWLERTERDKALPLRKQAALRNQTGQAPRCKQPPVNLREWVKTI